jgi:pyruvate/2-oxoglutarate dehydrogenase complex dihydrolipoamide acyltransferase (E2) component
MQAPADPFPAPAAFPARAESPFDDSPFQLSAEPPVGDALRVDDGALLPAGEPLFELDATDTGLRAGEFGDAPALETPSFETPSFEAPSFQTPSFEEPSSAAPSFETPSFDATPAFETPSFSAPADEAPSFEAPSFEAPSFEPPPSLAETRRIDTGSFQVSGFATTPEERLGVPQGAVPLVESRAETEARIEAPAPPSIEASHEPASTAPAAAPAAPLAVGSAVLSASASNGGGRLSDEDVDRIARRVVELMADKAIRDVAWEVIPDMAEVVIRDRLRELESQAESFE